MHMRRIFSIFFLLALAALPGAAQQIFLFQDFVPGSVFVGGSARPQNVSLNIDALGQRIYYLQGETLMELTQLHRLDSLQAGGHTFVMKNGFLCERLALPRGTVFVNWKFNKVNMGSAGALGITTQNKVEVLWTNPNGAPAQGEGHYSSTGAFSPEVWQRESENTYLFSLGGTDYRIRNFRDIRKAFPDKAPAVKRYMKENRLRMDNAQGALKIILFLRSDEWPE